MSPLAKRTTTDEVVPAPRPSTDQLLQDLTDPDPDVRRDAVAALAEVPAALPALVGRVGEESDPVVRDSLCTVLSRHDVPEVVDGVLAHLASDDAGLRNAVVELLALTPNSTAPRIPDLLADHDPDVRILTVMLLSTLRAPQVTDWLTQLVEHDPHPNVVAAAIGELAPLAGSACTPALLVARDRFADDPFIGFSVKKALAAVDGAGE